MATRPTMPSPWRPRSARAAARPVRLTLMLAIACGALGCASGKVPAAPPRGSQLGPPPQWQLGWADGAVFYEIFVRSFADSNGDGIGDLRGLTAKLDYLNDGDPATTSDLGVEGIWLMPVFSSPSYHGYDTTDYETINRDYGSNEDFQRFLAEAHRRGIRVILDLVVNHTGRDHPWFVDSASSPRAPRRDWYVWRDHDPGWKQPWGDQSRPTWHEKNGWWYYGLFWAGMPDLNFESPAVRAEVKRIARLWLDRGVDGFRLDAARHLTADGPGQEQNDTPETHAVWKDFGAFVRATSPQALLVGECWTSTEIIATYYGSTAAVKGGDELPMSFDFPLADSIVRAVQERDAEEIATTLDAIRARYPAGVLDGTFLTNHDMVRVATQLEGDPARERLAAAILLTLPGTPFLYYGEELGMRNGPLDEGDPAKRTPMPWDGGPAGGFSTATPWKELAPGWEIANVHDESATPGSLLSHYRALVHLRAGTPALRHGTIELLRAPGQSQGVLAFVRADAGQRVLVVHNLANEVVTAGPYPVQARSARPLFASVAGASLVPGDRLAAHLPPAASAIWLLE